MDRLDFAKDISSGMAGLVQWLERFFHDKLGWHVPGGAGYFDGVSIHSRCIYCGEEIMQDGQGNWF